LLEFPFNFNAGESVAWLDRDPASGTIPANGTCDVTVSIASAADTMVNGVGFGDMNFVNTTNHVGDCARSCQLTVGVPVILCQ